MQKIRRLSLSFFFLLCVTCLTVEAQKPRSLGDINKSKQLRGAVFSVQSGTKLFIVRTTESEGSELWVSDGNPSGTSLTKDIVPGPDGSNPGNLAAARVDGEDGVYFTATTEAEGKELWFSDGTEAGTVLVKDINPGSASSFSPFTLIGLIVTQPDLPFAYFAANDGTNGTEPWISDGTTAGTTLLEDINTGVVSSDPEDFVFNGTVAIFSARAAATGREPYTATGGTVTLIEDIFPGTGSSSPNNFRFFNEKFHFFADKDADTISLWRNDTGDAVEIAASAKDEDQFLLYGLAPLGETQAIYAELDLDAFSEEDISVRLLLTDGTEAGTSSFATLSCIPGLALAIGANDLLPAFSAVNDKFVFPCFDADFSTNTIFVTDGTEAGTKELTGNNGEKLFDNSGIFSRLPNKLLFFANDGKNGTEPWVTNGTPEGTTFLQDINPKRKSASSGLFTLNQTFYRDSETVAILAAKKGRETSIYATMGESGTITELFKNTTENTADSNPRSFTSVGKFVVFSAENTNLGQEIFFTRGKAKNTKLLKNIAKNGASSPGGFIPFKKKRILFSANDDTTGRELWATNGTRKGTKRIKDINPGSAGSSPSFFRGLLNNKQALFAAETADLGKELWITNGKGKGTTLLKDINPGTSSSNPVGIITTNNIAIFSAFTEGSGIELWRSDGTTEGTILLKDIEPGSESSSPFNFTQLGELVFFFATTTTEGRELWVTDGTEAGTRIVEDITAGATNSTGSTLVAAQSVVFFTASDGTNGTELWRSDGTEAGTFLIEDIRSGGDSSFPDAITVLTDNTILFSADDGTNGDELWISDAAAGSAKLVQDINPGSDGSFPSNIFRSTTKNRVYFAATTEDLGIELWESDGSEAGTKLVEDINPGEMSSSPRNFFQKGKKMYFNATTELRGNEPYVLIIK